jgi:hypothetical protein
MAQTREPPAQVFADYTTALQILSGYLRNHSQTFVAAVDAGKVTPAFGLGYGQVAPTAVPLDLVYAGDQVRNLGKMEKEVRAAADGARPAVDLSYDELISQPWHGVNLGWITVYMPEPICGARIYPTHNGASTRICRILTFSAPTSRTRISAEPT